jgi:hypothetical protein
MKNETGSTALDNLSNVVARLVEIEAEHVDNNDGRAHAAREAIVEALPGYRASRFAFGKLLAAYKAFFLEDGGWCEAAKAIGEALGCNERTVRRIVEDYQRAAQVPAAARSEMEARGIDPAAKKSEPIVRNLLTMPRGSIESDPANAVESVIEGAMAERQNKELIPAAESSGGTVRASSTKAEKRCYRLRDLISMTLYDVPRELKFDELIGAGRRSCTTIWRYMSRETSHLSRANRNALRNAKHRVSGLHERRQNHHGCPGRRRWPGNAHQTRA